MNKLKTPESKRLLKEAIVPPETLRSCRKNLKKFAERYLPLFHRKELRENALIVIRGLLSNLERKTCEPIAYREGMQRKPIQEFVGTGNWDDEAVMAAMRRHVKEEIADENGVLVIDPTTFPKKGVNSCGVKRQWCGRLGKIDNCQAGVFLAYASEKGHGPIDRRLFLPEDWAADKKRRKMCHVPDDVEYRSKWQIAADMIKKHGCAIPHGWVTADDEFGRVGEFRSWMREHGERYVLDVPSSTLVRDLKASPPKSRYRTWKRRRRVMPWTRVDAWASRRSPSLWRRFKIRDGEKQPLEVKAIEGLVRAGITGPKDGRERLVVIKSIEKNPRTWFVLANADSHVPLETIVRVHAERHRIEELFEEAKGETGLAHYEVRGWVGWHHHITLSLLSLWFLECEKRRLGKKNTGDDRPAGSRNILAPVS